MVKVVRNCLNKGTIQFPKLGVFVGQSQYYVIVKFKMSKTEFKFEYRRLAKKLRKL